MEHSKNFSKVKYYYDNKYWSKTAVRNAIGRYITEDEYKEITGEDYVAV